MKEMIFIFSLLVLLSWGTNGVYAQVPQEISEEYRALDRELYKDERGGMSYEALRGKYLEKLTRLKEQADALMNIQTGDVKTEEKKELVKCLKRMENNIFKLTTAQELLKQPRTKLVADSLRATTQDSEGYTKSSQIMRNYQNTLMREVLDRYPGKSNDKIRRAAVDSVFTIMRALRTVPRKPVKKTIKLSNGMMKAGHLVYAISALGD